jgi:hypothetical protein
VSRQERIVSVHHTEERGLNKRYTSIDGGGFSCVLLRNEKKVIRECTQRLCDDFE